jgi:hypothetical protein
MKVGCPRNLWSRFSVEISSAALRAAASASAWTSYPTGSLHCGLPTGRLAINNKLRLASMTQRYGSVRTQVVPFISIIAGGSNDWPGCNASNENTVKS